jgi:hypothetical protein
MKINKITLLECKEYKNEKNEEDMREEKRYTR